MSETEAIDSADRSRPLGGKVRTGQLDLLVRQSGGVCALPPALPQVLSLVARGTQLELEHLTEAVSQPPVARAALETARREHPEDPVEDASRAAELLGAERLFRIALCAGVMQAFPPSADRLDRRAFWTHCLAAATGAELAAERLGGRVRPLLSFACGFLHDLGKITLGACLPKSYRRVLAAADDPSGDIAEAERRIIGVDHALAGRHLAQQWRLPGEVEEVIWLHHHPLEPAECDLSGAGLIALVQLGDALAREQGIGYSGNRSASPNGAEVGALIGLSGEDVSGVADGLPGRMKQWADLIDAASAGRSAEPGPGAHAPSLPRQLSRSGAVAAGAGLLQRQLRCFQELHGFVNRVNPAMSLPQLCREMAQTASAILVTGACDRPLCAFCLREQDASVALAVCGADGAMKFRLSGRRPVGSVPPARGAPAGAMLRPVLDPPDAWGDLIDLDGYVCLPLLAEGVWLGGILVPAGAAVDRELGDVACEFMGFVLAAAVDRHGADRLAEQLALSSQYLAGTRKAMAHDQALEAVGEMAAGAAHEMNNPLAVISGRAQMLAEYAETAEDRKAAKLIVRKAEEISQIATELMAFARPAPADRRAVSVRDLLDSAREGFLAEDKPKAPGVSVDIEAEPDCPPVRVDPQQMREVVAELLRNASQSAEGPVKVRVEAKAPGGSDRVLIRVIDDGPGMDEAALASAFTPFYSQRPAGRGRGMGLAKARRAVQANGGRVWLESRPGSGTTVFLELPQSRGEV